MLYKIRSHEILLGHREVYTNGSCIWWYGMDTHHITKQWKCVCNIWSRFTSMDNLRINKRIFTWASNRANAACKNWLYIVKEKFCSLGFFDYADVTRSFPKRIIGVNVTEAMLRIYINDWKTCVNRIAGTRDRGLNKLRTYRIFKSEFKNRRLL